MTEGLAEVRLDVWSSIWDPAMVRVLERVSLDVWNHAMNTTAGEVSFVVNDVSNRCRDRVDGISSF